MNITWQFVTTSDEVSALIRWKTDSEISHVNAVTPEGKLLGALLDGGLQEREPNYGNFTLQILVTVPVTDEQAARFWQCLRSRIGEHYNCLGIVGIALGNNLTGSGHEFCSQAQSDAIIFAPIFRIAKDPSKIDPETLRLLLMAQPGATEKRIENPKAAAQSAAL